MSGVGAFLIFVLGFGFLVFVHELGHFLVAKAVGVKVTQFAIGFGHALCSYRPGMGLRLGSTQAEHERRLEAGESEASLGETEYRLNWMPLGGYVKMLGQEDLDPKAASTDPRSFTQKPAWARACVLSAGVAMNVVFGFLFFIVAFTVGVSFPEAKVGAVSTGAPAAAAQPMSHPEAPEYRGLRPGDAITHVDGQRVTDFTDLAWRTALASGERAMRVRVVRDGEALVYPIRPEPGRRELLSLGIAPPANLRLQRVREQSPLAQAGVEPGMRLVSVGGEPVDSFTAYHERITRARGQAMGLTFENPETGRRVTAEMGARAGLVWPDEPPRPHIAGLVPATRIVGIQTDAPADRAGVEPGDVITRIGDTAWPSMDQIRSVVGEAHRSENGVRLVVRRGGSSHDLGRVEPDISGHIGIIMEPAPAPARVAQLREGTPAQELEVAPGSVVEAVDGAPIDGYAGLQRRFQELASGGSAPMAVELRIRPAGESAESRSREIVLDAATLRELELARWDVPVTVDQFETRRVPVQAGPVGAVALGAKKTRQTLVRVYLTLRRLFEGQVQIKHLQGPVGITHTGTIVAQQGWPYLLYFLGLLSVNLAVINFLPIPVVDGGHIVFLIIEKIKGSPVSERVQSAALFLGLALIVSVFLVVTFYDMVRLIT